MSKAGVCVCVPVNRGAAAGKGAHVNKSITHTNNGLRTNERT